MLSKEERKKAMIEFLTRLLQEDPLGFAGFMVLLCLAIGCMVAIGLALRKDKVYKDEE